jgi:hypothetical protein
MPEARAMNVAIFLGRGERVQRAAHVHSRQPQAGRASGRATTRAPPATRCGRSTRKRSRSWSRAAASWRPRGPPGSMILFHGCLVHASDLEPLAVEPRERVSLPLRGLQPHSAASSAPSTSRTATSGRSSASRTIACSRRIRWSCPGRTARRPRR